LPIAWARAALTTSPTLACRRDQDAAVNRQRRGDAEIEAVAIAIVLAVDRVEDPSSIRERAGIVQHAGIVDADGSASAASCAMTGPRASQPRSPRP
jgi:hypothetical protein